MVSSTASSATTKPQSLQTQPPILSYADRAKKAQNISLNTKPPPIHLHPLPTPIRNTQSQAHSTQTPTSAVIPSTNINTNLNTHASTNSNSTPHGFELSLKSGSSPPSSSSVDATPSSSIILTRPQTRAVLPSPPASASVAISATEVKDCTEEQDMNGGDTSTSAIVTIAGSSTSGNAPPVAQTPHKPVVNVWSLRKEQMAQAQAQAQSPQSQSSSRPTVPQASLQAQAPMQISYTTTSPTSTRTRPVAADAAYNNKPPPPGSNASALNHAINNAPIPLSTAPDTNTITAAAAHVDDDPFVVRPPPHNAAQRPLSLLNQHPTSSVTPPALPLSPPISASAAASSLPSASAVPTMDDAESWPEVGKAASVPGGSVAGSAGGSEKGGKDLEGGKDSGGAPRKSEKTKWVQIPPSELQATADALAPRTVKSHRQSGHSRSRTSNQASGSGSSRIQSGRNSTSHSAAPSQSVSGAPSLTHSRAGSVHSSPRMGLGARGRKLPVEDVGQVQAQVGDSNGGRDGEKASRSGSPMRHPAAGTITGSADGRPPPALDGGTFYPPQGQPQEQIFHSHSQPHSHPQPQSHSPSTNQYALPGSSGYPNPDQNQNLLHHLQQPQPIQALQGAYQPQPYGGKYEYPHGRVPAVGSGPGQPYPMYWTKHDRLPPSQPQQQFMVDPQALHLSPQHQSHYQQQQQRPQPLMFGQVSGEGDVSSKTFPPALMMAQPPPPGEPEAVTGYCEGIPLSVVSNGDPATGAEGQTVGQRERQPLDGLDGKDRGRSAREVVFGSIGLPGADHSPSPVLGPTADAAKEVGGNELTEEKESDRSFPPFSIGVHPDEPDLIRRSRTRSMNSKGRGRGEGRFIVDLTNGQVDGGANVAGDDGRNDGGSGGMKVIDLIDTETKWEFGTTKHLDEARVQDDCSGGVLAPSGPQLSQPNTTLPPPPLPPPTEYYTPPHEQTIRLTPSLPILRPAGLSPVTTPPNGLHIDPIPAPIHSPGPSLLTSEMNGMTTGDDESHNSDEWEVKDYGYGFGPVSGTGYATTITREERLARERERKEREIIEREELERERERAERDRDATTSGFVSGRPRRVSYTSGGGYMPFESRGGYEQRGFEPRGGYEHRGGGYERSFARRGRLFGRGYNPRVYGRGTYQQQRQQQPQQPPPFTVTPPAQLQSLPQHNESVNGYYQPPPQPIANYIPGAYEAFQPPAIQPVTPPIQQGVPPVPVPLSALSFPLDPTRWYLLGQLEYYLSPQNLAQDFFLRQRMDSCGWIPISLIASFNRVRSLTMDARLVKDVLILSNIVEVQDDWVRMGGNQWQQFVLPDAPPSTLETPGSERMSAPAHEERRIEGDADSAEVEGEVDEEDDDDVVFVMGRDVEASWTAGRQQT